VGETEPKATRSTISASREFLHFLESYGEMRKGEQFVMGEVRARARERIR
jgi:hypothetical protein